MTAPGPSRPDERDAGGSAKAARGSSKVVLLAGGTGGAKLARGMLDVVGPDELIVIANTGDDIDIYGAHVSPDPDLVSFWLADLIDERGWGIEGDTFAVMDAMRAFGTDVWFNLGDRDLAWCLERRRMEDEGLRPTEALARLNEAIGVRAQVLPMCDEPLRTWVRTDAGWRDFQRFMIRERAEGTVCEVAFASPDDALETAADSSSISPTSPSPSSSSSPSPSPSSSASSSSISAPTDIPSALARPLAISAACPSREVLSALCDARVVILGPSNPVISIWPILHVLGDVLGSLETPIACVSPVVGGEIVKGPTAAFLTAYGQPVSAAGVGTFYETIQPGLIDGIVADEPVAGVPTLEIDTAMRDSATRARVAEQTLAFAEALAG
jgi:LPPG:FO 2-phospho-L-lactate transferase